MISPEHDRSSPDDDPRIVEALRAYQAVLDAGRRPNKKEFLSRYPADVAAELADCLDGLDLIRSAAPRLQAPEAPPLPPESQLGDFRLLREIGRGGMGVVYEAEQISLGRRVALKVLPLAATFDGRQLQRFENEARAAAHLHHGHIVPVFAVGSERGVPYYAMPLIDGRSLAAVIADMRQQPSPAAPAADTVGGAASLTYRSQDARPFFRTVARAGVEAAGALEYAHQMGVVHRDVKPANLLLDARGKLWVADFGLARFQENPGLTSPGDLVGTARYMSPEQASGRPVTDPRTDVYGLGVTLYEWLTGQPAFDGGDRQECLRQILGEEPDSPRRLNRAIPVELETIVLKAMAKSPDDRYSTAGELAADLQRFLDDRPILARPPSFLEQAAKWARRHHRAVATAALVLAVAVVGLAVTTWRVVDAEARTQAAFKALTEEQGRTATALGKEAAEHARAEGNYRQAREVLDYLERIAREDMAEKPEFQAMRRRLLLKLIDYYQAFIEHHRDDSTVADELAEAQLQVSQLLDDVGRKAEALAAFQSAMRDHAPWPRGGPPRGPGGPPRGIARLVLLGQSAVRRELKLSDDQTKRVNALLDFGGRPPSEEEARTAERGLTDVLHPAQAARLDQIIRQSRGAHALLDPDVARKLGLTERQKATIRASLEPWRPPGGPPRKGPRPDDEALRSLDPDQKAGWQQLRGKPFLADLRGGPPPVVRRPTGRMVYSYYEGWLKELPDFDRLTPAASGVGGAFDLELARRPTAFALRFSGYFRLERDEDCTFLLSSDDGSRLYIDGKQVVDNDSEHATRTKEGRVKLKKGTHEVVVTYFQAIASAYLAVDLRTPSLGRRDLGDLVGPTPTDLPPE